MDTKVNSPSGRHGEHCTCEGCIEWRRAAAAVAIEPERHEHEHEPPPDTNPDNGPPLSLVAGESSYSTITRKPLGDYECSVASNCTGGTEDEWFEVHYAATGEVFHFCKRHALAAEVLVTLGGWRARDIPEGLRMIERQHGRSSNGRVELQPLELESLDLDLEKGTPRCVPTGELVHTGTLVRCGQATCPSLAVYRYDWLGAEKFACLPCGVKARVIARTMGFEVNLVPLPGAPAELVENGA